MKADVPHRSRQYPLAVVPVAVVHSFDPGVSQFGSQY
jgi:hypothetical protein